MFIVGQGVLGQKPFPDGVFPAYKRPYLVVFVSDDRIGLLNVSSSAGKEKKLLYHTNHKLTKYKPPFLKDSFVKLDSLDYITLSQASNFQVLHNGDCLDGQEMEEILKLICM